jgi:hypothetical protein
MGHQKIFVALSAISFVIQLNAHLKNYALIKYPVVNLYNSSGGAGGKPLPAMTRNYAPCPRINQALFNETFQIAQRGPQTSSIIIPWAIYGYDSSGKPLNTYWVETKNLLILDTISQRELLQAIPHFAHKEDIIALKRPFTDSKGITYSVGTEFVCTKKQPQPHAYTVMRLNPQTNSLDELVIPKTIAYKQKKQTQQEARREFVKLLTEFVKDIAQQKPPFDFAQGERNAIPYVWGGNSFTKAYSSEFTEDGTGFHRKEQETVPLSGYDCSMLFIRFAHMVGIPYNFKTTSMLEKYGKKFLPTDTLQEGDLIWFQGHVVVITDVKNNLITEASGYENFVGKLQTIKISQLIKDIKTWDDLINAYNSKRMVMRLDKFGNDFKESTVKIFKLF